MIFDESKYLCKNKKTIKTIKILSIVELCCVIAFVLVSIINVILVLTNNMSQADTPSNGMTLSIISIMGIIQCISIVGIFITWLIQHNLLEKDMKNDDMFQANDEVDNAFLTCRQDYRKTKNEIKHANKRMNKLYIVSAVFFILSLVLLSINEMFLFEVEIFGTIALLIAVICAIIPLVSQITKATTIYQKFLVLNKQNIKIIMTAKNVKAAKLSLSFSMLNNAGYGAEKQAAHVFPNKVLLAQYKKFDKTVKYILFIALLLVGLTPLILLSFKVYTLQFYTGWVTPIIVFVLLSLIMVYSKIIIKKKEKLYEKQYKELLLEKDKFVNEIRLHDKIREISIINKKQDYYIYAVLTVMLILGLVVALTKISVYYNYFGLAFLFAVGLYSGIKNNKVFEAQYRALRAIEDEIEKSNTLEKTEENVFPTIGE